MKNLKNGIILLLVVSIALIFLPNFSNAQTTEVYDEDTLLDAIDTSTGEDIISLTANISLTRPIEFTDKTVSINGNNHTITKVDENWSPNGSNGTLITAGAGAKLTLSNLTLTNSQKYGVQSYNGGYVILDNVTISNCAYGGVLANAGTIEVRNLTLKKNGGEGYNNGIEIAKGSSITTGDNKPTLIMNGTLSSTETDNVIYVDINDPISGFDIINTEGTTNKVLINGTKLAITDQNNNIIYQSNDIGNINVSGDPYVEQAVVPNEPATQPQAQDETPKTGIGNSLEVALFIISASAIAIIFLKRKFL